MKYNNIKFFEKNPIYLAKMISDITGIDKEILLNNIEIAKDNNKKDFLVEFIDDDIILKISKNSLIRKTISNIISLLLGLKGNQEETNDLILVQIHLNYEKSCKNKISRYRIRNISPANQARVCIEISPILCDIEYQINDNVLDDIKWGAFFNSTYKRKKEILKDIMKKIN